MAQWTILDDLAQTGRLFERLPDFGELTIAIFTGIP
jgi:hypothetical protein